MRKVKIAVLVSGGGTNLQALIDSQKNGVIKNGEIVLVVSNKETAFALERAKKAKVKTRVVTKTGKSREEFESELIKVLRDDRIELVVLAGFMVILSERFTSTFKDRIINVHPSLIPSFCGEGFYGLKVHEKALEYGVKVTGATVHFVNEIPDGGKIIMQKPVEVLEGDTPEILQERVMKQAEWIILPLATEKVCSDILKGEM
ncbi:MAG: phosphoribosylglycinamide formyltransferase [Clostridiales bacterium]|nr:phosphoribosylglycinamide formyltransferase [Clostridiales bacterium]MDY5677691.1 phosphoribosylglycinamide formyltransferase [Eubacteriales bacterium]